MLNGLIRFCLAQRVVVFLLALVLVGFGLRYSPFAWKVDGWPRDPIAVDAIPDLGENQQIVFTSWPGRSPQDVEDQVTYPLTVALQGIPGVKTVRSTSYVGFSSIYVIFDEGVEFYWSRSRVLEKLSSLPPGLLPEGVAPGLGPDATPLGQVFWYTLEGRDEQDQPVGGWDLHELRSIQDWQVRFALLSADGVAEVASVGGYVREYQIDVDPDAMRAHGVSLEQIVQAVRGSNREVGARVVEINRVEYLVRGIGWIENVADLENSVINASDGAPVRIGKVAHVSFGPAMRRGALDKGGEQAVGGVVVVRYGSNPLQAIQSLKEKIAEIAPGLPRRELDDGRVSQVTIVPFYDRTGLIEETLGTLGTAISEELLVTLLVVLVMVMRLRATLLIACLLPLAVLFCFVCMKLMGVEANIVALSGIAIAIGTMVDIGIVLTENILASIEREPDAPRLETIHRAATEVGSAVLTAVATTIVGFLPVFTMDGAEGKLFGPLAWTKTYALIGSVLVSILLIPPLALTFFSGARRQPSSGRRVGPQSTRPSALRRLVCFLAVAGVAWTLARYWEPLGVGAASLSNLAFVVVTSGGLLLMFALFRRSYEPILRWCLANKLTFLSIPFVVLLAGASAWLGFDKLFRPLPDLMDASGLEGDVLRQTDFWVGATEAMPGLGKEFMPPLDEGSWLFMPTTMPHASIGEALDVLSTLDKAIESVPEVALAVGKIGRAESPLDPAPISMVETVVQMQPEWRLGEDGQRGTYRWDEQAGEFARGEAGQPIFDEDGRPYRNWRPEIRDADDVWDAIVEATHLLGTTSAPRLQPIAARLVMLQSGMRAPMGVKVRGPDLETIEEVGIEIEAFLKEVPSLNPATILADRVVGKPYIEIDVDRAAAGRYGVSMSHVQDVIEVALGGRQVTTTIEGRERYPVRVRYQRERRDSIEAMGEVLVSTPSGATVSLSQLATIEYGRGPQAIKTEDTFLTSYVIFDKQPGAAEVDVVEAAREHLQGLLDRGEWILPAGVSYAFAGSYENQVRAAATLSFVLPLALLLIFLILYLQFRTISMSLMVFSGVFVAWAGGFLLVWLYGQDWFLDAVPFGVDLRDLFQVSPMQLSVAVWVGFLALFGIATDDGVVIGTYIRQSLKRNQPGTVEQVRTAIVEAGARRVRPCLMTTATTLLALLPVLTSSGRGSDVMIPMAIPSFGGMLLALLTMFLVPVLASWVEERRVRRAS